jgi:hypothetical protein
MPSAIVVVSIFVVVIDIIPIIVRDIIIDCFEMTSFWGSLILQQCGATIAVETQKRHKCKGNVAFKPKNGETPPHVTPSRRTFPMHLAGLDEQNHDLPLKGGKQILLPQQKNVGFRAFVG